MNSTQAAKVKLSWLRRLARLGCFKRFILYTEMFCFRLVWLYLSTGVSRCYTSNLTRASCRILFQVYAIILCTSDVLLSNLPLDSNLLNLNYSRNFCSDFVDLVHSAFRYRTTRSIFSGFSVHDENTMRHTVLVIYYQHDCITVRRLKFPFRKILGRA